MNSRDINSKTAEWSATDSRIWGAHGAQEQEPVLAWVLPAEVDVIINQHLLLLADLGGFQPGTATDAEMELRSYALARLQTFVESGIVSTRKINIMGRLIIGDDLFPTDDEDTLRLVDLDFDVENFVDD